MLDFKILMLILIQVEFEVGVELGKNNIRAPVVIEIAA